MDCTDICSIGTLWSYFIKFGLLYQGILGIFSVLEGVRHPFFIRTCTSFLFINNTGHKNRYPDHKILGLGHGK